MLKKIIIAIDGHSSCGKSTLAKALAKALHYAYVDTGAMYRAVTLFFIRHKISLQDDASVRQALSNISIHFENIDGNNHTFLNGEDVEQEIRAMPVSNQVSNVSANSLVRRALVHQQQAMRKEKGIVLDGRDIGTVVFPDAELKIFLQADLETRINRRFDELRAKQPDINREIVAQNLSDRDRIDTSRADSPLRRAEDAILLDNTSLSEEEQFELVLELAKKKIQEQAQN